MRDDEAIAPTELAGSQTREGTDEILAPGSAAGEYELTEHLGSGAMGDVYAGRHPVIGKKVAVKVIKRRLADSEEAAQRFIREARAVNRVDHPNVADVFSFGRLDDGRLFLVMDLLEGESLGDRITRQGALAIDEVLEILEPVCSALSAAHRKGVVHRDLKPDNVFLVSAEGGGVKVYVLDFGIAKILSDVASDTRSGTLTGEGVWMGTPAYMAPEQWCSDVVTPAADIYALGAMTFQMLTGQLPYSASSVPQIMEKHFHAEVPALSTMGGTTVPATADHVISVAMAKKPEDRWSSAEELSAALADALGGIDVSHRRGRHATPLVDKESSRAPVPWAAVILGGGLLVAGAAAILYIASGKQERPAASNPPPPGVRVSITSTPRGARIVRDGSDLGITPFVIDAEPGDAVRVQLSKPGYATVTREVEAQEGVALDVSLPPVTGFEGVWKLPAGKLRAFQRHGDRVAGYQLASVKGKAAFLRFFEFQPSDGEAVAFGAATEHVDERAPNEPSCRIPLRAEYRYTSRGDRLEIRQEELRYELTDGKCVLYNKGWGQFARVERIAKVGKVRTVISNAGSATPDLSQAPPQVPNAPKNKTKAKRVNKKDFVKAAKNAKPRVRPKPKPKTKLAPPKAPAVQGVDEKAQAVRPPTGNKESATRGTPIPNPAPQQAQKKSPQVQKGSPQVQKK